MEEDILSTVTQDQTTEVIDYINDYFEAWGSWENHEDIVNANLPKNKLKLPFEERRDLFLNKYAVPEERQLACVHGLIQDLNKCGGWRFDQTLFVENLDVINAMFDAMKNHFPELNDGIYAKRRELAGPLQDEINRVRATEAAEKFYSDQIPFDELIELVSQGYVVYSPDTGFGINESRGLYQNDVIRLLEKRFGAEIGWSYLMAAVVDGLSGYIDKAIKSLNLMRNVFESNRGDDDE